LLVSGLEPAFDVPIVNVTVVAGQTAVLPCSIEDLGKYKVDINMFYILADKLLISFLSRNYFGKVGY